jgi:hypothetical protein
MWPDDECVVYVAKPAEGLVGRRLQSHSVKVLHEIVLLSFHAQFTHRPDDGGSMHP